MVGLARLRSLTVFVAVLSLFLTGCSGGGDEGQVAESSVDATTTPDDQGADSSGATTESSEPDPSSEAVVPTSAAEADSSESTNTTVPAGGPIPNVLTVLETNPTEAGPRPLLSWQPVNEAARYELTVLSSAGEPYWSWTGPESEIYLGGMENPEAIGAWVFEELSWVVTARDVDGNTLALSDRVALQP